MKRRRISDEVRQRVQSRSRGICEVCRQSDGLHLHHRKMRSQGGPDTAANLLLVCLGCHDYIHANPVEAYENGWLVPGWKDVA